MIRAMEQVLIHWGEQCRRQGCGVSLGSTLGTLMDWAGAPPRGTPGPRAPINSRGVDEAAAEVDAVLAEMIRRGELSDAELRLGWEAAGARGKAPLSLDTQLARLARVRYLVDPAPLVEQQMKRCGISGRRTYDRRVDELHVRVQEGLKRRAEKRAA